MAESSASFAANSVVDFLIPEATHLDIIEALESTESSRNIDDTALITTIPQRTLLYFDERVDLYIVLRTPYVDDESSIKAHIAQLNIVLEAHAISSAPAEEGQKTQGQPRDVIWSGKVDVTEDPVIVVEQNEDDSAEQTVLLIWKVTAFLSRPRVRLQAPAIIFKLSASLRPLKTIHAADNQYLPSGIPLRGSLFDARDFGSNSISHFAPPQQPGAGRITRPEILPLKIVSRRAFQAIPAVSSRLRYHGANSTTNPPAVVASLDLEIPGFAQHRVELEELTLSLNNGGIVKDLNDGHILNLPLKCEPQDSITSLYSLSENLATTGASTGPYLLQVSIRAKVLVSHSCQPTIEIKWKSNVDFSSVIIPNFRTTKSIQRPNRPSSLATPGTTSFNTDARRSSPDASADVSRSAWANVLNVTATFTCSEKIYIGEPFRWDIFIVNRSPQARRLTISMVPQRLPRGKGHRSTASGSSATNITNKDSATADAVMDENLLYAMIKSHANDPVDLLCLSSDLKVGPLPAGSCYNTAMVMLALAKGSLQMDAIRITDISTSEFVDVRDLPDLWVEERAAKRPSSGDVEPDGL